jgi:hypothetical protein
MIVVGVNTNNTSKEISALKAENIDFVQVRSGLPIIRVLYTAHTSELALYVF